MPDYRYELRRGEDLIATGHLSRDQPLEVGDRITIGSRAGIVRDVEPCLASMSYASWCSSRATTLTAESSSVGRQDHRRDRQ